MMLKFAGLPVSIFLTSAFRFISTQRTDGLSEGSSVTYRGVSVGQVTHVIRLPNDQIRVDATVDNKPPLPGNLRGVIRSTGFLGGGSSMALTLIDEQAKGQLQRDQEMPATYIGLDILPPEFAELATELKLTARQFRESNIVVNMNEQVTHLGKLIDSVQGFISDPKMRKDLQDSVANLRVATEKADTIGDHLDQLTTHLDQLSVDTRSDVAKTQDHIDELSKNIGDRMVQLAAILQQFQDVTQKINNGKGTAGQLVNDPKLYESAGRHHPTTATPPSKTSSV